MKPIHFLSLLVGCVLGPLVRGQPIALETVVRADHSYVDPKFDVSVTFPPTWMVTAAHRWGANNNGENTVTFAAPELPAVIPKMYYERFYSGAPAPTADKTEAWFRMVAEKKERARQSPVFGPGGYKNEPASFVLKQIGDRPAFSYVAHYSMGPTPMAEYFIYVLGAKSFVMFFTQGPAKDVTEIKSSVDHMAATLHVP